MATVTAAGPMSLLHQYNALQQDNEKLKVQVGGGADCGSGARAGAGCDGVSGKKNPRLFMNTRPLRI